MKRFRNFIIAFATIVAGTLASCYSDEGNYDYKTEEEAGKIVIDTIGIKIAWRYSVVSSLATT